MNILSILDNFFDIDRKVPNIKQTKDNEWVIELVVTGFKKNELEVTTDNRLLYVKGKHHDETKKGRNFEEKFIIYSHTKVVNVVLESGMLTITLETPIVKSNKMTYDIEEK